MSKRLGQCSTRAHYYPKVISALPRVSVYSTAQIADYPIGGSYGPRQVPDYELLWLLRGSARWTRQDLGSDGLTLGPEQVVELRPGMLALSRKGSRDRYRWDQARPTRHAFLHFAIEESARELGDVAHQRWPAVQALATAPVLDGLCRYLLDLSGLASAHAAERSNHVVALILDIMINGPRPDPTDAWPASLQRMVDFVREEWISHGMRMIEISDLAASAHLSAGHLHRLFRQRCDCGPAHALELVRLARAAISLQRSNAPLGTIALATGFANPYHFSRRFSAAYGCPPGAFRRQPEMIDPLGPIRRARLSALAQRLL